MTAICKPLRPMLVTMFLVAVASVAVADEYPSRPIRMIVPFPAGGLADVLARAVGEQMARNLGQPVVVENQAGAGGNTGAANAAAAAPDGYTLMMSSAGILAINQFLYPSLRFDPDNGFAPVSLVADMPMLLVTAAKLPVASAKELIEFARAQPGKLNFGSAGHGTTAHLALAMFNHAAGIELTHVPYRGAAPAAQDLVAGQIDGVFDNPPTVIAHIRAGSVRPLGVAAKERIALLREVPTISESGVPDFAASSWFGIVAPAGTPPEVAARLNGVIARAARDGGMKKTFEELGARLVGDSPQSFDAFIREERGKWSKIVREANVKLQ